MRAVHCALKRGREEQEKKREIGRRSVIAVSRVFTTDSINLLIILNVSNEPSPMHMHTDMLKTYSVDT